MDYSFKFICVGDSGVGKSCLLLQFTHKHFQPPETTIGIEFGSKVIDIDKKKIKLQIWDTAGQEAFKSISRAYYRGSIGCLIVYDVTKRDSFQHVHDWILDVQRYGESTTRMVLVANKIDMESSRVIASRVGMELADKYNMLYVETSAKTGLNVEDAYVNLAKSIFQQNNLNQNLEYTETQIKEMDARGIKVHSKNSRPSNITLGPNQSRDSGMCCS